MKGIARSFRNSDWFSILAVFPFLITHSGAAYANQRPPGIRSIDPEFIDLSGTYELTIPVDTFEADPPKLDPHLDDEEVIFSELISTRVRRLHFDPPVLAGNPFLVRTYAAKEQALGAQAGQVISTFEMLGQFEARLVRGLRGSYCSLEISGKRRKGTKWVSFQEYYVVLALGLKDEQSLWLGPVNTPANAAGGKHIWFVLVKISD